MKKATCNNTVLLPFLSLIFVTVHISLFFTNCSDSDRHYDKRWTEHIKAHTSGQVSRESNIKVVFTDDLVSTDSVGKEASGIFSISPSVDGKAEWAATNEIVFIPEKPLPSGEKYRVELDLEDYIKFKSKTGNFFFNFEVIKQDFDFNFEGFRFADLKNLSIQEFKGVINTADIVSNEKLEEVITAKQEGEKLKIAWEHNENRKQHSFTIKKIKRKKNDSKLFITWDGDPIDVDRDGTQEYTVTSRGTFKVLSLAAVNTDRQYVQVIFSDPLKQTQDLRGLVQITNSDITTVIENNIIKIFPKKKILGSRSINIIRGIKNSEGKKLKTPFTQLVKFEKINPGVRFTGEGSIIPQDGRLTVPFEAVNVTSVQVTALKVYNKNMGQFFQVNNYKGNHEIKRVGRYLWRKTIYLNSPPVVLSQWSRYNLDVTDLFKKHPNTLFQLTLSINRGNSVDRCSSNTSQVKKETPFKNLDDQYITQQSDWDYADEYYNNYSENWQHRENPCHDAYYNPRFNNPVRSVKNFFVSNIGMIAKLGADNKLTVITTDILSAEPIEAKVKVFNYQNVEIGNGSTSGSGFATIVMTGEGKPFYLEATRDDQKGYLKLSGDSALAMSHFDIGGSRVNRGVKGFIYGERGVWRPGDNIYLTFVLEDKKNLLPPDHPVELLFITPRGQTYTTIKDYNRVDTFYTFKLATKEDDPSGNWKAVVRIGGRSFTKNIKIETIKPNRLKINLDFNKKILHASEMPLTATVFSQWLHGANAGNLNTDVSVTLSPRNTKFTRFKDYAFNDLTRSFQSQKREIYSGTLDGSGNSRFELNIPVEGTPPGMLTATFSSRVHEPGGDYSIESFPVPFHPYKSYVGIKTPKGDQARGMLLTDKTHKVTIATIDSNGKPVSRNNIEVVLYKISWRYWWDKSGESLANFTSSSSTRELKRGKVSTRNGYGNWSFMVKYPDWGRYLVRVHDLDSGHSSSKIIYIDWPGWAGRAREEKGAGATRLNFSLNKKKFRTGEKATIFLPAVSKGQALVSIENGSRVIEQFWHETRAGKNKIPLKITEEMSPNVYVHVTLIQPHKNKNNDSPLRLYGALPLMVEDPGTRLQPVLYAPEEIKPNKKIRFSVKEKNGKAMVYTIAIVDEGLLGLTRFKTPDLHNHFYKREALGVRTWDIFDDIIGSYGARLERMLALGGGDGSEAEKKQMTKRRFPPIVKFIGPFKLKSGKKNNHTVTLPPYVGAVRAMVVAGTNGSYGSTEKSILVRKPMMILSTLPRVIGPNEEITIPVTVFVQSKSIKNVTVTMKTGKHVSPLSSTYKKISFPNPGEKIVLFKAKTGNVIGQTSFTFNAASGSEHAGQEVNLSIRNPNPVETIITSSAIEPGKTWSTTIVPHGVDQTNSAIVEVSSLPPINLEKRLNYLMLYPHGCIEQTVSSAFPQLYLDNLVELTDNQKEKIDTNIKAAINRISKFQTPSGGFAYWPNSTQQPNPWGTSYAGHFLLEAKNKGYYVPTSLLKGWQRYQKLYANAWNSKDNEHTLIQSYRLYTLALANQPQLGAMNRFKEAEITSTAVKWQLAAGYALAGQKDAARKITQGLPVMVNPYYELGNTFGSHVRDKAIILQSISVIGNKGEGIKLAKEISNELSSPNWHSTQTTAYALMALSNFIGKSGSSHSFEYSTVINGKNNEFNSSMPLSTQEIAYIPMSGMNISVKNLESSQNLYVTVTSKGSPPPGKEKAASRGLSINVAYEDNSGNYIDITNIKQGKDFVANISIVNQSGTLYKNMAMTYIIPSGWQIHNTRLETGTTAGEVDYQDFRDDRIYSYFTLKAKETKKFKVLLNASYIGKYYLPGISAEAMYNATIHASQRGSWVQVKQ